MKVLVAGATGTANLLEAAGILGAHRFVTQSMVFGYGYGDHGHKHITEDDPFGPPGRSRFEQHLAAMRSAEGQAMTTDGIGGVALRYGLFYGPGDLHRRPGSTSTTPSRPPWLPWSAAGPVMPTTWSTTSRCAGASSSAPWPKAINAPPPRTVPGWLLALAPYGANHD
jgi:hypothetical protein